MTPQRIAETRYVTKATIVGSHYCALPKPGASWAMLSGFHAEDIKGSGLTVIELYSHPKEAYPARYFNIVDEFPMRMDDETFARFIAEVKDAGYEVTEA